MTAGSVALAIASVLVGFAVAFGLRRKRPAPRPVPPDPVEREALRALEEAHERRVESLEEAAAATDWLERAQRLTDRGNQR